MTIDLLPGDSRVGIYAPQAESTNDKSAWDLARFPATTKQVFREQIGPLANLKSSSGCALVLRTDAPSLTVHLANLRHHQPYPQRLSATVLQHDGTTWLTVPSTDLQQANGSLTVTLPTGQSLGQRPQPIWLWLPPISTCVIEQISAPDGSSFDAPLLPEPTWLAIGDSITQGFSVSCPTETWVHRLQANYGPAWNLGIGGCMIEPEAFTWALTQKPWQRIVVGLGSNHAWRDATVPAVAERTTALLNAILSQTTCQKIAWILPPWKPLEAGQGPSHYMHVPLDADVARRLTAIRTTLMDTIATIVAQQPDCTLIDATAPGHKKDPTPSKRSLTILDGLMAQNERLYPDGLHPTGHATQRAAATILQKW